MPGRRILLSLGNFLCLLTLTAFASTALALDAVYVDSSAQVGVGTNAPAAPLHVYRDDGTATLRVEEQNGIAAKRTLYNLINNGQVRFSMEDTSTSRSWDFLLADDGFNISLVGSGGAEFVVRDNGGLVVGPGGAANLVLTSAGNMFISGTLTESSSRTTKTDIASADGAMLLAKLEKLPIAEWRYKNGAPDDRHVGPMAEDFYALFGLGADEEHISPKDLAGVALAAIQALNNENTSLRAEVDALKESILRLERKVLADEGALSAQ